MINLKKFEEFLSLGIVQKQSSDIKRAKNLIFESGEKLNFFERVRNKVGKQGLNPNYVIDTCYDIIIELIRAKLLMKGYKTSSHEAEVSYMRNLGFLEEDVKFMNNLRYFRNGIKYYGRILKNEYASDVIKFLYKNLSKLRRINQKTFAFFV